MNELLDEINKFGGWENYYQYLLTTYGETKQQKADFIKRTHTSEIQAYRGKQNTSEQQSIKGKIGGKNNSSYRQSTKGKIGGKNNTSEQQRIKGEKGGKNNTSIQQSLKGKKSAQVRYEGSNEQLKPWKALGMSRSWYYNQKRLGSI